MPQRTWRDACQQLLADVDPHCTLPRYLLDSSEAGGRVRVAGRAKTWGRYSSILREFISDWSGPGFCALFNVGRMRNWSEIESVCIHEYGHFIGQHASDVRLLKVINGGQSAECRAFVSELESWSEPEPSAVSPGVPESDSVPRPWDTHGADFVRPFLHLIERANCAGWGLSAEDAWCGYGLSPLRLYRAALGDEPKRLAGLPMSEVVATEAPASFVQFAESDLSRAESRFEEFREREARKSAETPAFSEAGCGKNT